MKYIVHFSYNVYHSIYVWKTLNLQICNLEIMQAIKNSLLFQRMWYWKQFYCFHSLHVEHLFCSDAGMHDFCSLRYSTFKLYKKWFLWKFEEVLISMFWSILLLLLYTKYATLLTRKNITYRHKYRV